MKTADSAALRDTLRKRGYSEKAIDKILWWYCLSERRAEQEVSRNK